MGKGFNFGTLGQVNRMSRKGGKRMETYLLLLETEIILSKVIFVISIVKELEAF